MQSTLRTLVQDFPQQEFNIFLFRRFESHLIIFLVLAKIHMTIAISSIAIEQWMPHSVVECQISVDPEFILHFACKES